MSLSCLERGCSLAVSNFLVHEEAGSSSSPGGACSMVCAWDSLSPWAGFLWETSHLLPEPSTACLFSQALGCTA